jgi:hypothetical protein
MLCGDATKVADELRIGEHQRLHVERDLAGPGHRGQSPIGRRDRVRGRDLLSVCARGSARERFEPGEELARRRVRGAEDLHVQRCEPRWWLRRAGCSRGRALGRAARTCSAHRGDEDYNKRSNPGELALQVSRCTTALEVVVGADQRRVGGRGIALEHSLVEGLASRCAYRAWFSSDTDSSIARSPADGTDELLARMPAYASS